MIRLLTLLIVAIFLIACGESDSNNAQNNSGVGGSTARFTIQSGFLVVVEENLISSFNLSDPLNPEKKDDVLGTDGNLETIFPFADDLIFIGSQTGSAIVKIYAESHVNEAGDFFEAGDMEIISQVNHARSCDPVVANETHMFVTIRDGDGCTTAREGGVNRLIVYDIRNIEFPIEVAERSIFRPFGLALDENILYVCSEDGLKVFDVGEPSQPHLQNSYRNLECNDVIVLEDRLIATGNERVVQIGGLPQEFNILSVISMGN